MNHDIPPEKSAQKPREKQSFEAVGEIVSIFLRGKTWYANYQLDGRQHRKSLSTTSLKEARRQAIRLEADILTGRFKQHSEVATIAEAVAAYKESLRTEKRAKKTIVKYDKVLDRVLALAESLKAKTMDRMNLAFMDRYRSMRVKEGRADKTIYNEATVVRQLVNFALAREMVFHDPMKGVKLKKPRPTSQPCWTLDEVRSILAAAPGYLKPALTLLAETGMRFGELAWLTWDDVDTEGNVLWVRPKDDWVPKTGDRRHIPISPGARAVLDALPKTWRWVTTMPASKRCPKQGRQWTERRMLTTLQRVLKALGLPGKIHTFRHFFISNALTQGIPTATVRSWVGHVDDKIIALYTHVHDHASQTAMQRLAEANSKNLQVKETENERIETEVVSAQTQHTPPQEAQASGATAGVEAASA